LVELVGDALVGAGRGVLIAHGHGGGGVAEACHQFGQRGPGLGREDCSGVAKVVDAQVGSAGGLARFSEGLGEGGCPDVVPGGAGEEQAVRAGQPDRRR
jgi:hypothetical protein